MGGFGPFLANIDISRWIKETAGSASRFEQRPPPASRLLFIVCFSFFLQSSQPSSVQRLSTYSHCILALSEVFLCQTLFRLLETADRCVFRQNLRAVRNWQSRSETKGWQLQIFATVTVVAGIPPHIWSRPSPTDWLTDRRRPCNWCSFNLFSNTDNPTLSERLTKTKPHLTTPAFKLINLFYLWLDCRKLRRNRISHICAHLANVWII